jgi:NAD(P)-dependent dehydrogenase (short-subunit alcohol dehydrogenase family)
MDKQVVLITGGSSGIGRAIGCYLKEQGYIVYGTTRNPGKYPHFTDFELLELDVQLARTINDTVAEILKKEGQLDILVNNAGVGITGPVEETPENEIQNVFATNFLGPVAMIRAVLPVMRNQGSGFIINITSIAGYMGLPFRGYYSASKGALELITESLRLETAKSGIRICTLAPGDFATNIAEGRYQAPVRPDSAYQPAYGASVDLMNRHVSQGQDPKRVGAKVHRILGKRNPRAHYVVGSPLQKFSVVLKRLLPDKLYEKLLLNHYKL